MEMTKKTKILIGIAGGLLVVVVILYAVLYGGGDKGDPIEEAGIPSAGSRPGALPPSK